MSIGREVFAVLPFEIPERASPPTTWKLRRGRGLSSLHALVVRAALSVVCPLNANRSAIHPSDVRRCMLRLTGELRTNSADPSLTPDTDGNLLGKDINNDSKLSTSRTVPHKIHSIYPRLDRLDPCCYVFLTSNLGERKDHQSAHTAPIAGPSDQQLKARRRKTIPVRSIRE